MKRLGIFLLTAVHVFGGANEQRSMNANVLVEGNLIKQVSTKRSTQTVPR